MILLRLFLVFLKIGAVSFGGGYGMIALIRDEAVGNGWLTEAELYNFVAVAESTPGPIAVNIATFVGSSQAGVLGALVATLGVVLPAFIVILIIASLFKTFIKNAWVQAALAGVRPVVIALILTTAVTMFVGLFYLNFGDFAAPPQWEWRPAVILAVLVALSLVLKRFHKAVSPFLVILLSAGLGVAVYAF